MTPPGSSKRVPFSCSRNAGRSIVAALLDARQPPHLACRQLHL